MGVVLPWTGTWEPQADPGPEGLPSWRHGWVPERLGLATRRQLRDLGLSIGPQAPCGRVWWGPAEPTDLRVRWGYLYRVELARPRRVHTLAQERARLAAMTARRTCHVCGEVRGYCIPRVSLGGCGVCWESGRCVGTVGPALVDEPVVA